MKSTLFVFAMVLCCFGALAEDPTHKLKIVLVGDSTVNDQGGWGYGFKQFVTPDVEESAAIDLFRPHRLLAQVRVVVGGGRRRAHRPRRR